MTSGRAPKSRKELLDQWRHLGAKIERVEEASGVLVWPMSRQTYQELGGTYLEQIHKAQLQNYFTKRLESLGFKVMLEAVTPAA